MNYPVAPWCGDRKGLWGLRGRERRRPLGLDIPVRVHLARAACADASRELAEVCRCLKITGSCLSSLSGSESSSTLGNEATPEECPALADSPTTLTEALQMIHPIPADSWRNLIEQIGGCPQRQWGVTGGNVGSWWTLRAPMLVGCPCVSPAQMFLTRKVIDIFGSKWFQRQNCHVYNWGLANAFLSCSLGEVCLPSPFLGRALCPLASSARKSGG